MPTAKDERSKIGGWPLTVAIAIILIFLFFVRDILPPFIIAAAIAFILAPVVDYIHLCAKVPRWFAAGLIYLFVLGTITTLAYMAGGLMLRDLARVVAQFPVTLHQIVAQLAGLASTSIGYSFDPDALTRALLDYVRNLLSGSGAPLRFASYGVVAMSETMLTLVVLIYFLVSGRHLALGILWLVPPEYRREVHTAAARVRPLLRRYVAGVAAVMLYTTVVAWIGFGPAFHLEGAALLAVVVGLLELIPVLGPAASGALVCVSALQQSSPVAVVALVVFVILLRLSIDEVVGPLILGRAERLHPVVIIFAFLSGAILFGLIGMLLAVPVAASIKIVLQIYYSEPVETEGRSAQPPTSQRH